MDIKKSALFTRPIAHRGLHDASTPENSLAAFQKAIDAGYPIELDVQPIDDGTIVVFHDNRVSRMVDRDGYVSNLTREDLEQIRLKNSDEKIPTFKEVLELIDGKVPLLVEIKNEGKVGALERDTLEMLLNYKGEYAVQSFNPYSLEYFKINAPQILRGQLASFFESDKNISFIKRFVLKRLKMNKVSKPDFISYKFQNLPNKYVAKTKLPVLAWTITNNADLEKSLPHCDNIIFEGLRPEFDK